MWKTSGGKINLLKNGSLREVKDRNEVPMVFGEEGLKSHPRSRALGVSQQVLIGQNLNLGIQPYPCKARPPTPTQFQLLFFDTPIPERSNRHLYCFARFSSHIWSP